MMRLHKQKIFGSASFLFLLAFLMMVSSCRKELATDVITAENEPKTFSQVFDIFWNEMTRNYIYWDMDTSNWQSIYKKYKPLFSALDLTKDEDLRKSVSLFREVCRGLTDAHFYMSFTKSAISDSIVYPGWERLKRRQNFHGAYGYFPLVTKYLDSNYLAGYDSLNTQGQQPLFVVSGQIKGSVLYFGCNQFSLSRSFYSAQNNSVKKTINYFFQNLAQPSDSLKGVVIDVRNNQGGDLADLNLLVSHLTDEPMTIGYSHTKSGVNPLDYSPWVKINITPYPEAPRRALPIILLTDIYSASVSELLAIAIGQLPGSKIAGEQSFGATGTVVPISIFANRGFQIKRYASIQLSSIAFISADGKSYEGRGISPDVYSPYNLEEIKKGRDLQLEDAIRLFQ